MNRKLKTDELGRVSADEYRKAEKYPLVIVLDNIRSLHNVGSAFRTADAFRVEKVVLCGMTACPPHREIHKTALGATGTVEWEYVDETLVAARRLKDLGYKIISMEQTEMATQLQDSVYKTGEKMAIVFGNEVFGVDQKVIDISDDVWEIPQFGTKHSLNVSVTIGVVLWDIIRRIIKG